MTDQEESETQTCADADSQRVLMPPDTHDLITVDQKPKLDLDTCGVYWIKRKCTRDGCDAGFTGLRPIGRTIESEQDYKDIAYELYESYYDNPRQISYPAVQSLVRKLDTAQRSAITDNLCDAAKLGCHDAKQDRPKRTKQEVVDTVLYKNPWY